MSATLFAAADREPDHVEVGAPREDSAENLLGLRGSARRRQASGEEAFGP
jgi:hypothetical protein